MTKQRIARLIAGASIAALTLASMAGCGTLINTAPATTDTSAQSDINGTADTTNNTNGENSSANGTSTDNAAAAPAAGDSSSQPAATDTPGAATEDATSGQAADSAASNTTTGTAANPGSESANLSSTAPPTFPLAVTSYGFSYTITGYQIAVASDGSTAIIIYGTGFDQLAQDSSSQFLSPVWCSFDAAGTTHQATACMSTSGTLTFTFDSADTPEWINLSNNQTKVQIASFTVTAEP
ncbi:MAG: hypothetical protein FWF30_01300 [Coriobacteriia bacterium]|nr:hypothetical protein [Coriobacteriia bacterium]